MPIHYPKLDKRLEHIKNQISEENYTTIKRFVRSCEIDGIGEHRKIKYVSTLKQIILMIDGKDLKQADREDIENVLIGIQKKSKSEETRHDYKVTLKKFYRWLNGGEEPDLTKFFKATKNKTKQKLPDELLTEEEIIKMIESTRNTKDQALIALCWDIGARIGEIGNLRFKHIKYDDLGAEIIVNGKTGYRRVRALFSIQYLMRWMEMHPLRDNPDAPLWVSFDRNEKNPHVQMGYNSLTKQIKKAAKKAGIKKRIHSHLFRHSRATYMANYLTEAQMNAFFGWVQGSDVPSIYIHLSGRDVDRAVLKAQGVHIEDEERIKTKPQKCPRCNAQNTAQQMFCYKCKAALNVEAAHIMKEKNDTLVTEIIDRLKDNPEVLLEALGKC